MSIYKDFDGQFLKDTRPKFRRKKFYERHQCSLDELLKIVYWAKDYKEAMRCFDNDVQEPPQCFHCGEHPGFHANMSGYPYRKFCLKDECQYVRNRQSHTQEAREKYHKTCMERYGYENPFRSEEWQEQNKQNFYNEYGVYNCMHLDTVKEKQKETLMEKYGVDHIWKHKPTQDKRKKTWIDNWGYDNPSKSPEVQENIKNTFYLKYGGYPLSILEFREKIKDTFMKKYGVDHYMKCNEGLSKWRNQFSKSHNGLTHPMHVPEIAEKQSKSSYQLKDYTSKRGNKYKVQGYEMFAIEILEDMNLDFVNTKIEVGNISYSMDGKNRKYYPDFYITDLDLYLEVKSRYTYERDNNKIECIRDSNSNLNLAVLIFSSNGDLEEIC